MRITRVVAQQGHSVPATATPARGPFPPELFRQPRVNVDNTPRNDMGDEMDVPGRTAQNGFRSMKWYRCRDCEGIVSELELDTHVCEDSE